MNSTSLSVRIASLVVALATAGAVAAAESSKSGSKTYRWVDKDGVVHFGDRVPPEYMQSERRVLNEYGVAVATQAGAKTPEQIASEKAMAERAEAARQKAILDARRDQVLLDTYLTVADIEALRDRRLELIDSQIKMTENYLLNLRDNLRKLQTEASNFKPYSKDPNAAPIDARLTRELSTTMDSILLYETNLKDAKGRKAQVIGQFDNDIDRFRQLKAGLDTP